MAMTIRSVAAGAGWRVSDAICTAGPRDTPFEERHDAICIAAVTKGTFQYRSAQGTALLGPGALLLGNAGDGFTCNHDHGTGDRCLAFHLTPAFFESVLADLPGAKVIGFHLPRLSPSTSFLPLFTRMEAARDDGESGAWEEIALDLAASAIAAAAGTSMRLKAPGARDQQRVSEAIRRIETESDQPLTLAALARGVGSSPYHFLRSFRALVGAAPYQFLLWQRMRQAAIRLRRSAAPVSTIAFEAGFGDLSTFNRRFRRVMGLSPTAYRRAHAGRRGNDGL